MPTAPRDRIGLGAALAVIVLLSVLAWAIILAPLV